MRGMRKTLTIESSQGVIVRGRRKGITPEGGTQNDDREIRETVQSNRVQDCGLECSQGMTYIVVRELYKLLLCGM